MLLTNKKIKKDAIADLIRQDGNYLYVLCPFCHKIHIHGNGGDPYDSKRINFGGRYSHCLSFYDKGHYIIKKTKLTTELKRIFKEE